MKTEDFYCLNIHSYIFYVRRILVIQMNLSGNWMNFNFCIISDASSQMDTLS